MLLRVVAILLVLGMAAGQVRAQSLLSNGEQTFLDGNGNPLAGGSVYFYIPGTTTPKTTYQDASLTVPNTNPVVLDSAGRAIIWGSGTFRQVVYDSVGNLIWDQLTNGQTSSALNSGNIFVGNGSNVATGVAMSKDCTMAVGGAITCLSSNGTAFGPYATATLGQLPGSSTATAANVGNIGEVISASGTVAIATSTVTNITGIVLSAGDWDAQTSCQFIPDASTQTVNGEISTSLIPFALDFNLDRFAAFYYSPGISISNEFTLHTSQAQLLLSGVTSVYATVYSEFAAGNMNVSCLVRARRMH